MVKLSDFEAAILTKMLEGEAEILAPLRQQYQMGTCTSRELTGVGFFCAFEVPKELALSGSPDFEISDVSAEVEGLSRGLDLLLFVRAGLITMLEGATYDEPYPEVVRKFRLFYQFVPRVVP
jgi:hypothetical protein